MKILKFLSENVKKIKAIEIDPDPNAVLVTGKNEAGKSSILDSIWYALGGERALPPKPVREGQERAKITLDLGEYLVERVIKANGKSALKVLGKANSRGERPSFDKPQTILNKLVGGISFDPLAFEAMSKSDRRDLLMTLVGLDLDEWEERAILMRKRIREAKEGHERACEGLPDEIPDTPDRIDVSELLSELRSASQLEAERAETERLLARKKSELGHLNARREKLGKEITSLIDEIEESETDVESALADLTELDDPIDAHAIEEKLAHAEEHNERAKEIEGFHELAAKAVGWRGEIAGAEETLKEHKEKRALALDEAAFPVEGLSIDAEGVTFMGLPFEQRSASERLRISLAIAADLNPTLRVILVPERARLDKESLSDMIAWAREKEYQLWIERVEDSPGEGLFIEDGGIVAIDGKEIGS